LRTSFPEIATAQLLRRFLESPFDEELLHEQFPLLMARNHSAELTAQSLAYGHKVGNQSGCPTIPNSLLNPRQLAGADCIV